MTDKQREPDRRGRNPQMDAFVRLVNTSPQFSHEQASAVVAQALALAKQAEPAKEPPCE